jgi:outer membrane murein-binding lipoprotein Lpp
MKARRRLPLAIVAAAVAALLLAGCTRDASNEQVAASLESAVTAALPELNGAFADLSYEGADHAVLLILYVKTDDPAALAKAVDTGFSTVWKNAPFRPSSVAVGAVEKAKPAHPVTWEPDSFNPDPIAAALGLPSGAAGTWIDLSSKVLTERYGAWQKPAER